MASNDEIPEPLTTLADISDPGDEQIASNAEISESLKTLEDIGYPRDEESDEAGKFDENPENRIHCLMTHDSSQREPLFSWSHATFSLCQYYTLTMPNSSSRPVKRLVTFPSTAALVN